MDSAIHWIALLVFLILLLWIAIYPVESAIQLWRAVIGCLRLHFERSEKLGITQTFSLYLFIYLFILFYFYFFTIEYFILQFV